MTKIIKYNDFIQINPDRRILSLDSAEKVDIIDNILSRSHSGGKGLVITYDLSHSGRKINNRIYSTKGQQNGIDSLTTPYSKPILRNHNQSGEPIGRFIGGEWQSLYDEAAMYLDSTQKMLDIQKAFNVDDPSQIYNTLDSLGLVKDKKWPGLGRMRVQANITDEDAIKKFMDGRYLTFSAGSTTDRHVCSICESDWAEEGMCEHRHGKTYDGKTCVFITGDFIVLEGSVVNTPADDLSQIVSMQVQDAKKEETLKISNQDLLEEIVFTDSVYEIGGQYGIQDAEQIKANQSSNQEEEEEEMIDAKAFDHTMSIPEGSMEELHKTGVTYIEVSSGSQSMTIKVTYSGSVDRDEDLLLPKNPQKSSTKQKDFNMIEKETIEEVELESVSEDSEEDLQIEDTSPTPEQIDESLSEEDSIEIDWALLDLALQGSLVMEDKALTTEERKELPDSVFCGPERSFPVPDCAHVTAAKRLIGRAKVSDSTKEKIMACVNKKAESLSCEKSQDHLELEQKFEELQAKYSDLETKLLIVLEKLTKDEVSTEEETNIVKNEENVSNKVENEANDALETKEEVKITDASVESPSVHTNDKEEKMSDKIKSLGSFEKKIVVEYKQTLADQGELVAMQYLASKAAYLPRGFNPNNF